MHVSGNGRFTRQCHALLEEVLGAPKVLLTTSCTDALEMAALLLDDSAGRRSDRAIVHVRFHGQRVCPARRAAGFRRHTAGHAEPGRDACWSV